MRTTSILYALMFLYVTLRVVWPLSLRWWWRVLLAVLLALGAWKFTILDNLYPGGRFFAPEADAAVLLPLTALNIFLILFSLLLSVAELPRAAAWCALRSRGLHRSRGARLVRPVVHGALAVLAAVSTGIGMHNALSMPQVKRITIELPSIARPVTLALMTDLHADTLKREPFFRALVQQVNALGADAVVIAGDFVDGTLDKHGHDLAPLAELRAPLGVYGVIGNHDYPSGYRDWLRFFRSCGIRMLVNEHAPLGDALTIAGVNDPMAEWNHEEAPNLPKALAGVPADRPVVLLAHEPVFADTAAKDKRVSLQLSGHTHGGLFPGLAAVVAHYNGGYVKGLYRVGSMSLYVSPGTSLWSGMPVRLFCPAEITLITLCPRAH